MHEYIEIQFWRKNEPFRVKREITGGFEFDEPDPPTRSIALGFRPYGDPTVYRMTRVRQVKGWASDEFKLRLSVEDGSLIVRGDDQYSLPEGFYYVTTDVSGAKVTKRPKRVEVVHDGHGVVRVDLGLDERMIEVDVDDVDPKMRRVLEASTIDGHSGLAWVQRDDVRPTRRACLINLLASLRVFPTLSKPLIDDVCCLFTSRDDRSYAEVETSFYDRVAQLSESHSKVYPEGRPHAEIHNQLIPAIFAFDAQANGAFGPDGLLSFRAEGQPSLQMVIASPRQGAVYDRRFADLDLDLGNPLQDLAGLVVHIGELLDGKPTNHLDLRRTLAGSKARPYLCYKVRR